MPAGFTHLHVHSCFSFLDGASWPHELVARAQALGMDALALTDHDGLYGAVRFYEAARQAGIRPILGAEVSFFPDDRSGNAKVGDSAASTDPANASHLSLLAQDRNGYRNLCRLLSRGHLRGQKGRPILFWSDIAEHAQSLIALSGCARGEIPKLLSAGRATEAMAAGRRCMDVFGAGRFLVEMQNHLLPDSGLLMSRLAALARSLGLRIVATNDVHYAQREQHRVHDVLTCIRTLTPVEQVSSERKRNCEYALKSSAAMARLFRAYPAALAATRWVADQCSVDLELGSLHFPQFPTPGGETPYSYLCKLSFQGAQERYHPLTPEVLARLQHELEIVNDLGFAEYFLVVWDVARYARSRGIRYSGRGSAVNSILTYCLGVTTVDPIEHNLLFERFLNRERRGMPDVDIDFCARRRDEVIDYVYKTYGAGHVAMVCTLSTLNARSALRDVGRAMGTAPDQIDRLAKAMPHTGARNIRPAMESLPELRDAGLSVARMRDLLDICEAVDGFPRHMSVHLAGVLITRDPLTDYTPLEWSSKGVAVSQFNKDDVEAIGLVKLDLLGLRNLSALDDAVANVKAMRGIEIDLDALPLDDPAVYALLRSTQTIGVFQLESPGMRGLLGRLQPERFHDLIINIALFRPGPMKANMIDPFIARRHGLEPICYLHPGLEPALSETYGVLIFQEQVLRIASAIAGFSLGQSDRFRKAMTHDRSTEEMAAIGSSFVEGAKANGVEEPVARSIFQQLSAFAAYGFCKAHAAAFAYIAYQTAYMKVHYPAEFLAGVLANEPMGFYSSSTIVQDARRMGIPVLTVHVNRSHERCGVEWTERSAGRAMGIRLGLAELRSMTEEAIQQIIIARGQRFFSSLRDFCVRTHVSRPIVENLVRCGAFAGLGPGETGPQATAQTDGQEDDGRSRLLLWQIDDALRAAEDKEACLLDPSDVDRNLYSGLQDAIPAPTLIEKVQDDYNLLGLTTCCHPIRFFRDGLSKRGAVCCAELLNLPHGAMVKAAGIVISCMKPPTRSGKIVVFVSLEDETGVIDCTVFPKVYDRWGYYLFHSSALVVEGRLQRLGARALNLLASKIEPLESPDAQPMPASRPDCPSGYRRGPGSV